jgi:hypothetical protein
MADVPIVSPEPLRIIRRIVTPGVNGNPPASETRDAWLAAHGGN